MPNSSKPDAASAAAIEAAITGRRSVRAFRPDPLDRALVERILDVAARAPSGTNMQPWRVRALTGAPLAALAKALVAEHHDPEKAARASEYQYYPEPFFEPFLARRRKVGFDMYGLLGIARGETDKMSAQHAKNFMFFGAPVGLVFTISRRLAIGSWLDYGMFLQNVMIAARAHGLETCAQAAFAPFHETIRRELALDADEMVVCGMSLGFADETDPVNGLVTERVPARDFTDYAGWGSGSGA